MDVPLARPLHGLPALGQRLRQARHARRLSQLELAARIGASQRHVAFVELARARPGRELLLRWLDALQQPLLARNAALAEAGYAPVFDTTPLSAPALRPAVQAIEQLLRNHDPMPALVLDHHWNLVDANDGAAWLFATVLPELTVPVPGSGAAASNLLDAMASSPTWLGAVANLAEIAPTFLARVQAEAEWVPELTPRLARLASAVAARGTAAAATGGGNGNHPAHPAAEPGIDSPVQLLRLRTRHGELAFFSLFTTFGTPRHIELASLRIEHLFAADEATRRVLGRQVPGARR